MILRQTETRINHLMKQMDGQGFIKKAKRNIMDNFDMPLQKLDKLLERHIFMAKKGQIFKKYSPEFKLSVIMDMRNNNLGYNETMRKYNINSHTAIDLYKVRMR